LTSCPNNTSLRLDFPWITSLPESKTQAISPSS